MKWPVLEDLKARFTFTRANIIPLVFAVGYVAFVFLGPTILHTSQTSFIFGLLAVVLSILMIFTMVAAAQIVMTSFFYLSAELSLLIFLAQEYCDHAVLTTNSNDALRGLIVIGMIYIGYKFARSLYDALVKGIESFGGKWSLGKVLTTILFLSFVGLFVWWIYEVTDPIILSLCVYK